MNAKNLQDYEVTNLNLSTPNYNKNKGRDQTNTNQSTRKCLIRGPLNNPDRIDKYGKPISHGGKKNHHIEFKQEIAIVHEVQSYKKYNAMESPSCCCNVF